MSLLTGQGTGNPGQATSSGAGGGSGNQGQDWRASLPEDLRSEKAFESIQGKDWSEAGPVLAKSYLHAQRLVGADKLVIPGDNATPEQRAEFFKKLGRPDKPEEYGVKLPEGMTEDKIDKARLDLWRKEMHEAGLPKAAAERLLSKYLAEEHGSKAAADRERQQRLVQNELTLKEELGAKFDESINHARYALTTFGDDALSDLLEKTGMGSDPAVVKFFAKIGEKLAEGGPRGGAGGGGGASGNLTPEVAQAELTAFNRNGDNMKALFDKNHPMHDDVVKRRAELYAKAYPAENKE